MRVSVVDKMLIGDARRTSLGFLAADARIARTGIYEYRGTEMGMPDKSVVRVYRDDAVVFSEASMASFAHKPVTLGHPRDNVTAANWRDEARGYTGDTVKRDGEFVRVPLIVTDAEAIARVDAGDAELSAGYSVDVDPTPGVTDAGEAYDARMTGVIAANHVAIVRKGRAGSQCRIGDSAWPENKEPNAVTTKTITFDGLPLLVTDAAEAALAKRDAQIAAADIDIKARDTQIATLTATVATHAADVARLTAALADAPARLAAATAERTAILADAAKVAPEIAITDVMDASAIRKAIVTAKVGDAAKDWTDAQYLAAYAVLPRVAVDTLADGLARSAAFVAPAGDPNKALRDKYLADMNGAHLGKAA